MKTKKELIREVCGKQHSHLAGANGWIAIKLEEDLPTENIDCFCIDKNGRILITHSRRSHFWCSSNRWLYRYDDFTHYQPITKPKPPLNI